MEFQHEDKFLAVARCDSSCSICFCSEKQHGSMYAEWEWRHAVESAAGCVFHLRRAPHILHFIPPVPRCPFLSAAAAAA